MASATTALLVLATSHHAHAQSSSLNSAQLSSSASAEAASGTILTDKRFTYPGGVPYMVDVSDGPRGIQTGYNLCNSTTEGPSSMCQTAFMTSVDDFCLWGPPTPNSLVADDEGEMVAWCTKPGRGTRIIPDGAIKGIQFLTAPDYIQITGTFDQTLIDMAANDTGGELDPHGADQRGNPLGGLVFSQAFSNTSNNNAFIQVIEYHNFVGSNSFCFKACNPASSNDASLCNHIYDRIGAAYNCIAQYPQNEFLSCESDNQLPPGVYVSDGQTMTYTQPAESLGAISTIPFTPVLPSSSNCQTLTSSLIFTAAASAAASSSSASAASASSASAASAASASSVAATRSSASSAQATATATMGTSSSSSSNTGSSGTGSTSTTGAAAKAGVSPLLITATVATGLIGIMALLC
ncbi:hypothetical protein E5Q_05232 [Mixia osmundae IAM 14324]|uniref:Macrofage activating glycoprotein n=2 Tax=Mixia osmundae (strain CBS 9802 / IAM 14324 / JCM 22182 / KY 12970) TaxID=764103 RepID=G7E6T5_MIXOS|nr:hypothetical protein E5Q_05232 [Mixia osmundae IAM 14324]